jgi:P27 family predicted phage terminase small subunit
VSAKAAKKPSAPRGLNAAGKQAWDHVWRLPWITSPDRTTVEHFARLEDEATRLCRQLDKDGTTLTRCQQNARGEVIGDEAYPHPALRELRAVDRQLMLVRQSLGLDPRSRAKLRLQPEDAPDELDYLRAIRETRLRGESTDELEGMYAKAKADKAKAAAR